MPHIALFSLVLSGAYCADCFTVFFWRGAGRFQIEGKMLGCVILPPKLVLCFLLCREPILVSKLAQYGNIEISQEITLAMI